MRPAVVVTLVLVCLAAAPARAEGEAACEAVSVTGKETKVADGVPSFSLRTELDLTFTVRFSARVRGEHVVHVELRTPRGHLYERISVPVSADAGAKGARKVPGYARPVVVQPLQPLLVDGHEVRVMRVAFPVGGSAITQRGLYGRWRAEVFVDDGVEPCGGAELDLKP